MAAGFAHAILDLMAFGHQHLDLHRWKDEPWRLLGTSHRVERHEWYQAYNVEWTDQDPFPISFSQVVESVGTRPGDGEEAEQYMAWAAHDFLDRKWDSLSPPERQYWEGFFVWALFHPEVLKTKFGVDVEKERILRTVDGAPKWEDAPGLCGEYGRLREYTLHVVRNKPALGQALRQFG